MRYNFHEHKDAIKKNPNHILPSDINAPVIDYYMKIGAKFAAITIEKLQKCVNYAVIEVYKAGEPNKKYKTEVHAGMCAGVETNEIGTSSDGFVVSITKTIRNKNLDMSKLNKGKSNDELQKVVG
jgi:hypothetical protein